MLKENESWRKRFDLGLSKASIYVGVGGSLLFSRLVIRFPIDIGKLGHSLASL